MVDPRVCKPLSYKFIINFQKLKGRICWKTWRWWRKSWLCQSLPFQHQENRFHSQRLYQMCWRQFRAGSEIKSNTGRANVRHAKVSLQTYSWSQSDRKPGERRNWGRQPWGWKILPSDKRSSAGIRRWSYSCQRRYFNGNWTKIWVKFLAFGYRYKPG